MLNQLKQALQEEEDKAESEIADVAKAQ